MVTPKGKCEQWHCHTTRDRVPQPNAALDGLPNRSVWERLKSANCCPSQMSAQESFNGLQTLHGITQAWQYRLRRRHPHNA